MTKRLWSFAIAAALAIAISQPAQADLHFGGGAGALPSWNGEIGTASIERLVASILAGRLRLGGRVGVAKYKTDGLGADEVDVKAYNGRAILQWLFFPKDLSPYVGVGASFNVVERQKDQTHAITSHPEAGVRLGVGGIGFAGVHMPVGEGLSLFGEGRAGVSFDSGGDYSRGRGANRIGGFSGMAGMTLSF